MDVSDCKSVCVKLSLLWLPDTLHAPVPSCFWKQQHLLGQARAEDGGDVAGKVDTVTMPSFHRNFIRRILHFPRFSSPCPQSTRSVVAVAVCPGQGREAALCLNIRLSLLDAGWFSAALFCLAPFSLCIES